MQIFLKNDNCEHPYPFQIRLCNYDIYLCFYWIGTLKDSGMYENLMKKTKNSKKLFIFLR